MFYVVLQIFIPLMLIFHGYNLRCKTPPFNAERGGLNTWRTREGAQQWDIGNKAGGVYCIVLGAVLLIAYAVKLIVYGDEVIKLYNYLYGAVGVIGIFSMPGYAHHVINKKMGVKGPKLTEPHVARQQPAGKAKKTSSAPSNALKQPKSRKKKKK